MFFAKNCNHHEQLGHCYIINCSHFHTNYYVFNISSSMLSNFNVWNIVLNALLCFTLHKIKHLGCILTKWHLSRYMSLGNMWRCCYTSLQWTKKYVWLRLNCIILAGWLGWLISMQRKVSNWSLSMLLHVSRDTCRLVWMRSLNILFGGYKSAFTSCFIIAPYFQAPRHCSKTPTQWQ